MSIKIADSNDKSDNTQNIVITKSDLLFSYFIQLPTRNPIQQHINISLI